MASQERVYSENQTTAAPLAAKSELAVEKDETVDILKKTAASLHSFNSPNTFSMVHSSNNPDAQEEIERLLNAHFYPLNLANTQSVVAFLLLTCFVLKKQTREAESLKKLYEDHISLLKDKNTELEDKLLRNSSSTVNVGGNMSPDCSSMSPVSSASTQDCSNCDELKARVEVLTGQVAQLQRSYDEVCHVNGQWAQDYEALSKQIRNATGFHSGSDSLPSSAGSTSMHISPPPQASGGVDHPHLGTAHPSSCVRCSIYKSQLEDSVQEVEDLRAQVVGLREDIKDCKERLNQKQQEMRFLENEYQILRVQVQEIGDLQLALNMKQEYRKMQRNLQQKTKLYQDAMCEKLDLQKQVEKLRQAFLKCFPIPAPLQAAPPTSMNSRPPASGSYYSFPLHSCRNNLQSSTVDSNPPTPPGLLARGDMKGAIVEKDDQMVPRIKLDRDQPPSSRMSRHSHGMQSRSLEHLDIVQDPSPRGRSLTESGKGPQCGTSVSLSPGALRGSDMALNNGLEGAGRRDHASAEYVSRSRSNNYISHSSASSSISTDMVMNRNGPLSSSHSGNSLSHSNTALHYVPSSLSSLGYGSNDSSTSLDSHSLNHSHRHAPYTSRLRAPGPSEMELVHREMPDMKLTKSQLGRSSSFSMRPSSLSLAPGAPTANNMAGKSQFFYCPNCKKSFSCVGKDSFDSWFEHVKSCSA